MKKYLTQKQWFRNIFPAKTYILVNNTWKEIKDFKRGEKITNVDGKWNTQLFCSCGNELVHSESFVKQYEVKDGWVIEHKCSHCEKQTYSRPDIIPGLLGCDQNGNP